MNKTINDFIEYAHTNLIWFSFNTVLIIMPVVCILILNKKAESLDIKGAQMSYTSLLTIVCLANLLQFILRPRLYKYERKSQLYTIEPKENPEPAKVGAMGVGLSGSLGGMLGNIKAAAAAEDKPVAAKKDMGEEEKDLIREDDDEKHHYVWMQAKFNEERLWVWIVNLVAYIAVVTTYFCVDGHEIIYSMYLPLDMMLNVSKAAYFFTIFWLDRREKAKQEELQKVLKEGVDNALKTGIAAMMRRTSQNPDSSEQQEPVDPKKQKRVEQMKLKYEAEIISQKKKQRLLDEVEEKDKELDLDDDTYTMAFRALNWECMK